MTENRFSDNQIKRKPDALQKQVGESPLLKLWDESDTLFSR